MTVSGTSQINILSLHGRSSVLGRPRRRLPSPAPRHRERRRRGTGTRSEEHTSELQLLRHLVCRLLLENKQKMWRCIRMAAEGIIGPDGENAVHSIVGPSRPNGRSSTPTTCVGWTRKAKSFFFNEGATPEIYTLSLHDALPI